MVRLDYCEIYNCLVHYANIEDDSQDDMTYALFAAYCQDPDVDPIDVKGTAVTRWKRGEYNVSPNIREYYVNPDNAGKLASAIKTSFLGKMPDYRPCIKRLIHIVRLDDDITDNVAGQLLGWDPLANQDEAAKCIERLLIFVFQRPFIPRDIATGELILPPWMSNAGIVVPVLRSNPRPKPCIPFVCRGQELTQLEDMFGRSSIVYVNGDPGVGKSELIYKYMSDNLKDYTCVLYISYSGDLRMDIASLNIPGRYTMDDVLRLQWIEHTLRYAGEHLLLVIDNMDADVTTDPYLDTIYEYGCRVIITTRQHCPDDYYMTIREIEDTDALLEIYRFHGINVEANRQDLIKIIEYLNHHTMAVSLVARLLKRKKYTPEQIRKKLILGRLANDISDRISYRKDGKTERQSYLQHIRSLFRLCKLSAEERNVVSNLVLMPTEGIDIQLFEQLIGENNPDVITDLMDMGLIQQMTDGSIRLYPILREVAQIELSPSYHSCAALTTNINSICCDLSNDVPYYDTVCSIISEMVQLMAHSDNQLHRENLRIWLRYAVKYDLQKTIRTVADALEAQLRQMESKPYVDWALLLDARASIQDDKSLAVDLELQALNCLQIESLDDVRLAANLCNNIATLYSELGDNELALQYSNRGWDLLEQNGLSNEYEMIAMATNRGLLLCKAGQAEKGLELLHRLEAKYAELLSTHTYDYAAIQQALAEAYTYAGNIQLVQLHSIRSAQLLSEYEEDNPKYRNC